MRFNSICVTFNSACVYCNYWNKNNNNKLVFGGSLFCKVLDVYYEKSKNNISYMSIAGKELRGLYKDALFNQLKNFRVYYDFNTLRLEVDGECEYNNEIINYIEPFVLKIPALIEEEKFIKERLNKLLSLQNFNLSMDKELIEQVDEAVIDFEKFTVYIYRGFLYELEEKYNITNRDICLLLKLITNLEFQVSDTYKGRVII